MSWKFNEIARVGAESALDACDYFVDEVIEPWKILGKYWECLACRWLNFTSSSVVQWRRQELNFSSIFFRFPRSNPVDEAQRVAGSGEWK